MRLNRMVVLLALFHAYIGWRLLSPFGPVAWTAGGAVLAASFALMPKGWQAEQDRWVMLRWVAMGFFSWALLVTLGRDLVLLVLPEWRTVSAAAVLAGVPLITAVGYFMARRVAPVKDVRIRVANLPPALHGFTIAQLSDIHVGPTIKRPFVQAMVDRVNRLDVDLVAITGDLVDGPVSRLAEH